MRIVSKRRVMNKRPFLTTSTLIPLTPYSPIPLVPFLEKMAKMQLLFFILKEKLTFLNFGDILSMRGDICHFLLPLVP